MAIELVTDRLPERLRKFVFRMINYALIAAFLLYLIVMGIYLSWISRRAASRASPRSAIRGSR